MWDGTERVTVTGWVDDVRSFLGRGSVFIAPMFEGVGLRGKILEAWAMAKPVVGTSLALQGLERAKGRAAIVADDHVSFADHLSELLEDENSAAAMGNLGRQLVVSSYSWDAFADLYHTVYCDAMRAQA
jgi:glycosyltransferase involved in cell wall biosynthesis